jgi:ribosomal protein S27AE
MGMKDGECPECGSDDIRVREGLLNNHRVMFQHPKTHIYVCTKCGYVAEFVSSKDREYIHKNWDTLRVFEELQRMSGETTSEKRKNDE